MDSREFPPLGTNFVLTLSLSQLPPPARAAALQHALAADGDRCAGSNLNSPAITRIQNRIDAQETLFAVEVERSGGGVVQQAGSDSPVQLVFASADYKVGQTLKLFWI